MCLLLTVHARCCSISQTPGKLKSIIVVVDLSTILLLTISYTFLFQATCGFPEAYTTFLSPVQGTQPFILRTDLIMQLENENPTSFVVGSANRLRSAFIGSSTGNLLKVGNFSVLLIVKKM